ncbi:hypothetical protein ECG_01722 [Echinococcus granulosus]|uniref:CNNM transmembrane domain-containing protein n=1 Tax=Echinococcus granulosus TaxID=6210 RepID=A0A068W7M2_ECHGR|nr:hypothetical protein ECG_01722 [Echinococcus granulosus]CDS15333.1 hypothetical protein EgrG_002016000 [Echinococcus granulosus]
MLFWSDESCYYGRLCCVIVRIALRRLARDPFAVVLVVSITLCLFSEIFIGILSNGEVETILHASHCDKKDTVGIDRLKVACMNISSLTLPVLRPTNLRVVHETRKLLY